MSIFGLNLGRLTGDDAGQWDNGNQGSLIGGLAGAGLLGWGAYQGLAGGAAAGAGGAAAGAGAATTAGSSWGPAAAIGGLNLLGGMQANQQNAQLSRDQMAFQERMSSTAHQREVNDLIKAGLNPLLSVNAGASSPSGSQATMQNPMQSAISSALEAKAMHNAMAKQREEIALIRAQANKTNTEARIMKPEETKAGVMDKLYNKMIDAFTTAAPAKSLDKVIINPKDSAKKQSDDFQKQWLQKNLPMRKN